MRNDAGFAHFDAPPAERIVRLLQELCARERLGPAETEAVIRKAVAEPAATPVGWPPDLTPQLRQFVLRG